MKSKYSLGFFEMPWVIFCMIPMTITFFSLLLIFPSLVQTLGSFFFLSVFIAWIIIFKTFDWLTGGYKFYLSWLVKKKLK